MQLGEGIRSNRRVLRVKMVGRNSLRAIKGVVLANRGRSLFISRVVQNLYYYNIATISYFCFTFNLIFSEASRNLFTFFNFLLMNSLSLKHFTSKSIDLKNFPVVKTCKRAKTDRTEHKNNSKQSQISQNIHELAPLIGNPKEFQSIFSKRKRSAYGAYKNCNLSKCKYIKFEESKQLTRQNPHRNYQTNLKNIAKLRKKYSLEPRQIKISLIEQTSIEKSSPLKIKVNAESELAISERKHHKNLRELMKNIFERKPFEGKEPIEKEEVEESREFILSTNHTNNCLDAENFHRYQQQPHEEINVPQQEIKKNKIEKKIFNWKRKKLIDYHLGPKCFHSHKKPILEQQRIRTQEDEIKLCGWQSQIQFY